MISDFAVMFSIILWVVVNFLSRIQTKSLVIPDVLSKGLVPTACNGMETNCTARTWIVDPLSTTSGDVLPVWGVFAAVIPAILAVILIFMDQQITAVIVNKKDFKLKVRILECDLATCTSFIREHSLACFEHACMLLLTCI